MKTLISIAFALFALGLLGCSSSQSIPLSQVQPKRVFKVDRPDVYNAIRMYILRDQFDIDSFEDETGRVIAHKVLTGRREDDPKTIIMNLRVIEVEKGVTEVNARFTYYLAPGVLKKDEEAELVDCYMLLFDIIGQEEK